MARLKPLVATGSLHKMLEKTTGWPRNHTYQEDFPATDEAYGWFLGMDWQPLRGHVHPSFDLMDVRQ